MDLDALTAAATTHNAAAIIPARAGSKGIPRKCEQPVGGTPLLVRAAVAAREARSVHRVLLSTDDEGFADLGRRHGAEVPFLRPPELAHDTAPITDVVRHLCEALYQREGALPRFLVLLQPTSPFVTAIDIDAAFDRFDDRADAVVSVCESEVKPDWMRRVDADGYLRPLPPQLDRPQHTPRQQMPTTYRVNGAIYWIRTDVFLRSNSFLPPATRPYVMPQERSVDIDTPFDLKFANWLAGEWDHAR